MPRKNQNQQARAGFTIIEVVLVLAIAGLIFLMVFVALPALQRSQRDTARRNDMSRVATALTQYQTNNNGALPGAGVCTVTGNAVGAAGYIKPNDDDTYKGKSACVFIAQYMNSTNSGTNEFVDPDGTYYGVTIESGPTGTGTKTIASLDHNVYIELKAKCDGESAVPSNNDRDYAILYKLEGAGTYCADNQ